MTKKDRHLIWVTALKKCKKKETSVGKGSNKGHS
jgi:hypothetical protein